MATLIATWESQISNREIVEKSLLEVLKADQTLLAPDFRTSPLQLEQNQQRLAQLRDLYQQTTSIALRELLGEIASAIIHYVRIITAGSKGDPLIMICVALQVPFPSDPFRKPNFSFTKQEFYQEVWRTKHLFVRKGDWSYRHRLTLPLFPIPGDLTFEEMIFVKAMTIPDLNYLYTIFNFERLLKYCLRLEFRIENNLPINRLLITNYVKMSYNPTEKTYKIFEEDKILNFP